jgi:tetratricopeptide (TPR) repeat protein
MALDRPGDAAVFIAKQLEFMPDNFELLTRLADALRENGQFEEAIIQIEKAQKINPDHPGLEWAKGQNLLLLGRYVEGFKAYESRYLLGTDKLPTRDFGCPKWLGQLSDEQIDITGKTILVHDEQGFGDTIMAGRFLRMLKEKVGKEGKLIFQTKDPMLRLFEESGADMIINALQTAGRGNIPQPDYHMLMMSLPGAFGITTDTIPPPMNIHIPEKARRKFKFIAEKSPPGVVKIGIVWSGSNNWDDNHKRGLPLEVFLRLAENQNHRVYSLQKDVHAGDLYMTHNNTYIEDLGKLCDDFADTAAAIEQLDIVIMTDTSVAHLAGSMGKRVINLIQRLPYWIYWFGDKTRTPWYPSMELVDRNNYGNFFEQDFSVIKK